MHSVLCTRVSKLHVPKSPTESFLGPLEGQKVHKKDGTVTSETRHPPSALRGAVATVGGALASAFKPRPRLQQGPPSGMALLMVVDTVRLPQVTHAGLATRDPTCRPPLQGVVSPQNLEPSAATKGCIKQRMVQNAFSLVHKSLHTTCPKITHGVLFQLVPFLWRVKRCTTKIGL